MVFWLGDLNYRVSEVVQLDEVFRRCDTQEGRDFLQAHDQLNLEVNHRSRREERACGLKVRVIGL